MEKKTYEPILENEMPLTPSAKSLFSDISKWTKFLSIIGFIFIGLTAIMSIITAIMLSGASELVEVNNHHYYFGPGRFSWWYVIICLVVLLIYFFPVYFLFKFSTGIKKAVDSNYTHTLYQSFDFLKKHYMFIGILTIIGLVFFLISCISMISGMMMM